MTQTERSPVTEIAVRPPHGVLALLASMLPIMITAAWLAGCTGAQQTRKEEETGSPPAIVLSAEQIHSPSGDMTAHVPKTWVTVDAEKLESPQVFAMFCNPEYTLSAVFTETPVDNTARGVFSRDGLKGLVDASFQRHRKRSNGRAVLVGSVEEFAIGRRQFAAYTYTTDSSTTMTRVAVFYTTDHLYECAMTQLTFTGRDLASPKSMRAIHQLILGSIEW